MADSIDTLREKLLTFAIKQEGLEVEALDANRLLYRITVAENKKLFEGTVSITATGYFVRFRKLRWHGRSMSNWLTVAKDTLLRT